MTSAFLVNDCVGLTIDGRFTLLQWLGGTDQSSVFLTELPDNPPKKAVIKLTPANAPDADARFAQWEAAGALSHPHLLRVFGVGRCEVDRIELIYVVTEYADEVLSEILRERPLTPAETREMLDPVLDALSHLHSQNLVHGHLKPSNVMVVNDHLKLSTDHLHAVDEPGAVSSNSKYDAPEIAFGKISPASDVWSLGVVIGEALTQRPRLANGSTANDAVLLPTIPPPFFGIVRECMRLDPARRSTLAAIRDSLTSPRTTELVAKVAPTPTPAAATSGAQPPTNLLYKPRSSRKSFLIAAAGLGGVLIITGLIVGYRLIGSHQQPSPTAAVQSPALAAQPQSQTPTQSQAPTPAPTVPAAATHAPAATKPTPSPVPATPPETQPPATAHDEPSPQPESAAQAPSPDSAAQPALPTPEAQTNPASGSTVKGQVASQSLPDVPQHIQDTIHGHFHVRVAVQVDADGNVTDATLDSPGPSQYFANQSLKAARNWKFKPAEVGGRAVASTWILQFNFANDATTVTPTETAP